MIGQAEDGSQLDLLANGVPVRSTRPSNVADTFANRRWRHYVANVLTPWPLRSEQRATVEASRTAWLRWRCAEWNRHALGRHQMRELHLVWLKQRLGHPEDAPLSEVLWREVCSPSS